ncbi:MAG: hypothetical protein JKY65_14640 [Planctomycetes bacterium]|nr:hypothetical protein [Planctomycetota bacterium]
MPGTIQFPCPHCGVSARVPASYAGQQAKCSSCAQVVVIPSGQAAPASAPPGVIAFHCACGNRIEVLAAHAGTQGNCNVCGGAVQVPGGQQVQAQPPPAPSPAPAPAAGPIVFNCPQCQTLSQVDPSYAGQQCLCPTCGTGITIPHQSTAVLPQQPAGQQMASQPAGPASRPAAPSLDLAPAPGLDLAPERGLDLAEPEPEIAHEAVGEAIDEDEDEDEPEERPRRGKRGARKGRAKKGRGPSGPSGEKVECMFCFSQIPASAEACPSCGMEFSPPSAPARGGRSQGRSRTARGGGQVQVFAALREGISDFANNALFCCIALVIFQAATTIAAVITGFGAVIFAGMVGSLPGVVIAALGSVVVTLVVVTYLLQGLFAFWLACARDEKPSLILLFTQPISGAISGFAVQVVITIAYIGLSFAIGLMINTMGSLVGVVLGLLLFFLFCCLLVLISGLAQIYIVDQRLGFGQAISAASASVSANTGKLLGYTAICLGAWFVAALIVSVGLGVSGIAPDPGQPAFGKILLSGLIQSAVSLAFLSVLGTSLTRIYLQISGR